MFVGDFWLNVSDFDDKVPRPLACLACSPTRNPVIQHSPMFTNGFILRSQCYTRLQLRLAVGFTLIFSVNRFLISMLSIFVASCYSLQCWDYVSGKCVVLLWNLIWLFKNNMYIHHPEEKVNNIYWISLTIQRSNSRPRTKSQTWNEKLLQNRCLLAYFWQERDLEDKILLEMTAINIEAGDKDWNSQFY